MFSQNTLQSVVTTSPDVTLTASVPELPLMMVFSTRVTFPRGGESASARYPEKPSTPGSFRGNAPP